MRTFEERLIAGQQAYAQLQATFDPDGSAIARLRAAGVARRRIESLYPLNFAAYLPQVQQLVYDDWALAKQSVEACYAGGKLSADRFDLAGLFFAELNEFYEEFVSPTSTVMDGLFEATLKSYTENLTWMPMPSADRTELEQAHAEVGYLMVNLALSAWLLANWQVVCASVEQQDSKMGRSLRLDVLDVTQNFFDRVWAPLIKHCIE